MIACRDCRHCELMEGIDRAICHHPKALYEYEDWINGTMMREQLPVSLVRSGMGACGKDAVLFEPREDGFV